RRLLFFSCSVLNQYLHSFPTRRSSDLGLVHGHVESVRGRAVRTGLPEFTDGEVTADGEGFFERFEDQLFVRDDLAIVGVTRDDVDRKSTRLNSSHVSISYAVFCLKKKN